MGPFSDFRGIFLCLAVSAAVDLVYLVSDVIRVIRKANGRVL